jgi:hypothetical protein
MFLGVVDSHLFMGEAIDNVKRFADETKLTEMLGGGQRAGRACDVSDGPFCNGFETLGDSETSTADTGAELHKHLQDVIRRNQELVRRSNDKGKMQVGIKVVESQALFVLSFSTYDP